MLEQLNPSLILVNAGAHETLLDDLVAYCKEVMTVLAGRAFPSQILIVARYPGDEHDDITVQICASRDFYINASLNRLASVHILRTTPAARAPTSAEYINEESSQVGSASPGGFVPPDPASAYNTMPQGEIGCKEILNRLGCFTSLEAYMAVSPVIWQCSAVLTRSLDSIVQLGAGGALLTHLERVRASHDDHGPIVFRNVQALAT